jgi:hypothetical protein
MPALLGQTLCFNHSPSAAKARSVSRKKGGRKTRIRNAPSIRTPASTSTVMLELTQALADAKLHPNSLHRGQLIVRLGLAVVKVLEVTEIELRLNAVEERLAEHERRLR